jgi:Protein of unknown function (DUF4239)
MNQQLLDPIPLIVILALFALVMLLAYEIGFRIGRWWQDRTPDENEGPTGVLVGSLLGLLAFMLAITMGMSADRFDTRRGMVLAEANAIGTAYLRAGYQPAPHGEQVRELLREYTPLRIGTNDRVQVAANIERSREIHAQLWAIAEELVRTTDNTDLLAMFVGSINDVIELDRTRVNAGVSARVPETIILLLLAGSALAVGIVGYSAGMTRRRSLVSAVVLIVALSAVTVLVLDLDRPQDGILQVSQRPLVELQSQIGPPPG